jgi:hypothetical protein
MGFQVRTQAAENLFIKVVAFLRVLLNGVGHGKHIVKNQAVGNQVIVLDNLGLFFPIILSDDSFAAKG